jgi:DNA-binding NarL/FixJ family response regulator
LLLVDDHTILREGLRAFFRYKKGFKIVGEAEDGAKALELVERQRPDVVLMDIAMPNMNGIEATRAIRKRFPQTEVLILSQYEDKEYVLPLIQVGAAGYILKNSLGNDLIEAIHSVVQGDLYLSPAVARVLAREVRSSTNNLESFAEPLTPREEQILPLIVNGKTNAQIALALSISINTVVWHRSNLMSKLGVHNVAELVNYAWQHGLLNEEGQ